MSPVTPPMREAMAWADTRSAALRADDPRFSHVVVVHMEDGSHFYWDSAFFEKVHVRSHDYVVVFTEHYGHHVFAEDEIASRRELRWAEPEEQ